MAKAKKEASALPAQQPSDYTELVRRLSDRYAEGRQRAAAAVNANMLEAYWQMGHDIVEFEQGGKAKAEYGAQLLDRLSADLRLLHGKGFSHSNLARMRQFYLQYPILRQRRKN